MTEPCAVHLDAAGTALAVCDGPELLVYNNDLTPRWKQFGEGILVDVCVARDSIRALDADGRLTQYRSADGQKLAEHQLEGGGLGLDLSDDGLLLARTGADVVLVEGNATRGLGQGATSAAAFGATRATVGVGWQNGSFRLLDLTTGQVAEIALGAPVAAICWSNSGAWVVAAGNAIHVLAADAASILATIPAPGPVSHLAMSEGGVLGAAVVEQLAFVFETHANRSAGTLGFKRGLAGVAWGPGGMLIIGLDDGDASRVDVFSRGSIRTEPHPGRGRNTWSYDDKLDVEILRGAAAFARAGGTPIARYEGPPEGTSKWVYISLGIFGLFTFVCISCTLLGGVTWYLRSIGIL